MFFSEDLLVPARGVRCACDSAQGKLRFQARQMLRRLRRELI